jgi:hypothetical protein
VIISSDQRLAIGVVKPTSRHCLDV